MRTPRRAKTLYSWNESPVELNILSEKGPEGERQVGKFIVWDELPTVHLTRGISFEPHRSCRIFRPTGTFFRSSIQPIQLHLKQNPEPPILPPVQNEFAGA